MKMAEVTFSMKFTQMVQISLHSGSLGEGRGEGDKGGEERKESLPVNPWFFHYSRRPACTYFYWSKSIVLKG